MLFIQAWQPSSVLESTLILRAAVSLRNMVKIAKSWKIQFITYLIGQNPQDVELEWQENCNSKIFISYYNK